MSMNTLIPRGRAAGLVTVLCACALASTSCGEGAFGPGTTLVRGTWGGNDAGLILTDATAHVHFGCTNGDFPAPIELGEDGRFSVSGEYLLHAYPVAIGPTMPAELAGVVRGRDLTMTVAVNDTVNGRLVVLGPTTVTLGHEPRMQMCPICAMPD